MRTLTVTLPDDAELWAVIESGALAEAVAHPSKDDLFILASAARAVHDAVEAELDAPALDVLQQPIASLFASR